MKTIMIFIVIAVAAVATFVPYSTTRETIIVAEVTANYIVAGDIEYHGERIGASSELFTLPMFEHEPVITVEVEHYLFFTRRVPA